MAAASPAQQPPIQRHPAAAGPAAPAALPAQALFLTAAEAPPGFWEGVAACVAPTMTRAQRTMLQQLWHAFAGHLQAIRCACWCPGWLAAARARHGGCGGCRPWGAPARPAPAPGPMRSRSPSGSTPRRLPSLPLPPAFRFPQRGAARGHGGSAARGRRLCRPRGPARRHAQARLPACAQGAGWHARRLARKGQACTPAVAAAGLSSADCLAPALALLASPCATHLPRPPGFPAAAW